MALFAHTGDPNTTSFTYPHLSPHLSPHKQCWKLVPAISPDFKQCIGWGGGRQRISVPRTFIHNCSLHWYKTTTSTCEVPKLQSSDQEILSVPTGDTLNKQIKHRLLRNPTCCLYTKSHARVEFSFRLPRVNPDRGTKKYLNQRTLYLAP